MYSVHYNYHSFEWMCLNAVNRPETPCPHVAVKVCTGKEKVRIITISIYNCVLEYVK